MTNNEIKAQTYSDLLIQLIKRLFSVPFVIPAIAIALIIAVLINHVNFSDLLSNPLLVIAGSIGLILLIHILAITGVASWARQRLRKKHKTGEPNVGALETEGQTILWARFYDRLVWLLTLGRVTSMHKNILQHSQIKSGDRVLDVGCGTGDLVLAASALVTPDGEVYGIDASEQMINTAKSKAAKRSVVVNLKTDLIESISFPDNHFDVVLNTLVMHHLPDDLKMKGFSEIYRVLKPGGYILITDMEGSSEGTIFQRIPDLIINLHGGHKAMKDNVSRLAPMAEAAGFDDVKVGRLDRQLAFISAKKPLMENIR